MEYALEELTSQTCWEFPQTVLILVLMEYALEDVQE